MKKEIETHTTPGRKVGNLLLIVTSVIGSFVVIFLFLLAITLYFHEPETRDYQSAPPMKEYDITDSFPRFSLSGNIWVIEGKWKLTQKKERIFCGLTIDPERKMMPGLYLPDGKSIPECPMPDMHTNMQKSNMHCIPDNGKIDFAKYFGPGRDCSDNFQIEMSLGENGEIVNIDSTSRKIKRSGLNGSEEDILIGE